MICCWLYDLKHICDTYFNFFKNKNKIENKATDSW